jgi:hypothetical protein
VEVCLACAAGVAGLAAPELALWKCSQNNRRDDSEIISSVTKNYPETAMGCLTGMDDETIG